MAHSCNVPTFAPLLTAIACRLVLVAVQGCSALHLRCAFVTVLFLPQLRSCQYPHHFPQHLFNFDSLPLYPVLMRSMSVLHCFNVKNALTISATVPYVTDSYTTAIGMTTLFRL